MNLRWDLSTCFCCLHSIRPTVIYIVFYCIVMYYTVLYFIVISNILKMPCFTLVSQLWVIKTGITICRFPLITLLAKVGSKTIFFFFWCLPPYLSELLNLRTICHIYKALEFEGRSVRPTWFSCQDWFGTIHWLFRFIDQCYLMINKTVRKSTKSRSARRRRCSEVVRW